MAWIISRQKRARRKEISLLSFYQKEEVIESFEWILFFASSHIAVRFWNALLPSMDRYTPVFDSQPYFQELGIYPSPSTWWNKALVATEKSWFNRFNPQQGSHVILYTESTWKAMMTHIVKPSSSELNLVLSK